MLRCCTTIVSMTFLWLLACGIGYAEDKAEAEKTKLRTGEAAIEEALDAPTRMEFAETPLSDVMEYLKDYHGIEIKLDNRALEDLGIGTDTPVTANFQNISLRSALSLLLKDLSMALTIQHDVLLITTPEEEECIFFTKVYDVSDLVVYLDQADDPWDDYNTLIDLISSTVNPSTWDACGGPGAIHGASLGTAKVLIVSQRYEVQREVARLLAEIRAVAAKTPDRDPPRQYRSMEQKEE